MARSSSLASDNSGQGIAARLRRMLVLCALAVCPSAWAMTPLSDDQMADVSGQALFKSDYIAPAPGGSTFDDFAYYRIALDAELALNANVDKVQLGCGGFNDGITPGCDIDMDYVRFMGPNGGNPDEGSNPVTGAQLAGSPVTSAFKFKRPYVEFAVKNDGSVNREIVGFRLGTELVNGLLSVGSYNATGSCNTPDNPNCHTGINTLSGDFNMRLQGTVNACVGSTTSSGNCGGFPGVGLDATVDEVVPIYGTRMDRPVIKAQASSSLLGFNIELAALLKEDLRFLHNINLKNTTDFGISFQRERVAWPTFEGTSYLRTANTGWWFTAPNNLEVTDVTVGPVDLSVGDAIGGLLGAPVAIENRDTGQRPADNCWGNALFC